MRGEDEFGNPTTGPTGTRQGTEATKAETHGINDPAFTRGEAGFAPPPPPAWTQTTNTADLEQSRRLRDQLLKERQAASRSVPVVTAAQANAPVIGAVERPTAATVAPVANVSAPTIGTARDVLAPTIAATGRVDGGVVNAARIGPVERVTSPVVGSVTPAHYATATAATLDTANQNAVRNRQDSLATALELSARGLGPSAAQAQLQKGVDAAIAAQRSMVAGTRGTGRAGALLRAGQNIAEITQKSAADAAILKAQEQQAAQGRLASVLDSTRGQDIGVATTEANLKQQANLQNAQMGTQVNLANLNVAATRALKQSDLELAAAQGNQAAQNEMMRRQAELTQQASTSTAQMGLQAALANQSVEATRNLTEAELGLRAGLSNQNVEATRNLAQADLGMRAGLANQNTSLQTALADAANQQQANVVGSTEANKMAALGAQLGTQVDLANAGFTQRAGEVNAANLLTGRQIDDAKAQGALSAAVQTQAQILGRMSDQERNAILQAQVANAKTDSERSFWMKVAGGVATIGGAAAGFYVGGLPGAVAGATAGSKVGDALT